MNILGGLSVFFFCVPASLVHPFPAQSPTRSGCARCSWETTCQSVRGRDLCRTVAEDSTQASTRGRGYIFDVTCVKVQNGIPVMLELRGTSVTASSVNQKPKHSNFCFHRLPKHKSSVSRYCGQLEASLLGNKQKCCRRRRRHRDNGIGNFCC